MDSKISIREDFKSLIPPLSADERQELESSILEYGCRDALITWRGWVIDGHNRYEICLGNGIAFETSEMDFENDNEVKMWMIRNQFSRRNLDSYSRSKLAIALKGLFAEKAKENQGKRIDILTTLSESYKPINTREEIAKVAGLSEGTISKVERIERDATPEVKQALERQEISINQAYIQTTTPSAHVTNNSGENEWYTPAEYIEAARWVLGGIALDPASNAMANETVQADCFFDEQTDGLSQDWSGTVWMNPPYAQPTIRLFCEKLCEHYTAGDITAAVVLTNNATETGWFQTLVSSASAVCFPKGRIRFWAPGRPSFTPLQGQAFIYFGENQSEFAQRFSEFGTIAFLRNE